MVRTSLVKSAAQTHREVLWHALSSGSFHASLARSGGSQGRSPVAPALPRGHPEWARQGQNPPHPWGTAWEETQRAPTPMGQLWQGHEGPCRQCHQPPACPSLCQTGKKPRKESRTKGVPHTKCCLKSVEISALLTLLSLVLLTNVYHD